MVTKHYSRRASIFWAAFGLVINNKIEGVVVFGQPSPPIQRHAFDARDFRLYELARLVVQTEVKNAASFLVGSALRMLPAPCAVVSYADSEWGPRRHHLPSDQLGIHRCHEVARSRLHNRRQAGSPHDTAGPRHYRSKEVGEGEQRANRTAVKQTPVLFYVRLQSPEKEDEAGAAIPSGGGLPQAAKDHLRRWPEGRRLH